MPHVGLPSRWPQGGQQDQCVLNCQHLTGNQRAVHVTPVRSAGSVHIFTTRIFRNPQDENPGFAVHTDQTSSHPGPSGPHNHTYDLLRSCSSEGFHSPIKVRLISQCSAPTPFPTFAGQALILAVPLGELRQSAQRYFDYWYGMHGINDTSGCTRSIHMHDD